MNSSKISLSVLLCLMLFITSCSSDDDAVTPDTNTDTPPPTLEIPSEYSSANYTANVTAEDTVINELATMTSAANDAEAAAQTTTVAPITYPSTLSSVTLPTYRTLVESWLVELVAAANSPDGFINPGFGNTPDGTDEGGLLGTRLLDEYGLELEQMVQKGSFGAALYRHAIDVITTGNLTDAATIDRLVEIHGTDPSFNPDETTAAATYSRRRSNQTTETGFFYDIKTNLITAKAAIEAGSAFDSIRDQALNDYLLNWEKSNFATVIYYCNAAKGQLEAAFNLADGPEKDAALGNALHAYAEGVAFAYGFRGATQKQITDAQIDSILEALLTEVGQAPESYRFLNDTSLLPTLDTLVDDIQAIYEFTEAEVELFFVNDPS